MMNRSTKRRVYLALLLTMATAGAWRGTNTEKPYSENLAKHRKQFKVTKSMFKNPAWGSPQKQPIHISPKHAITGHLDYLLARRKAASQQIKYVQGHTIQIYTGSSRKEAFRLRNCLYTHYPANVPEIVYEAPNYTVRVGKFLDILEAYPSYAAIKKRMPQAMIRPVYFVNEPNIFTEKKSKNRENEAN